MGFGGHYPLDIRVRWIVVTFSYLHFPLLSTSVVTVTRDLPLSVCLLPRASYFVCFCSEPRSLSPVFMHSAVLAYCPLLSVILCVTSGFKFSSVLSPMHIGNALFLQPVFFKGFVPYFLVLSISARKNIPVVTPLHSFSTPFQPAVVHPYFLFGGSPLLAFQEFNTALFSGKEKFFRGFHLSLVSAFFSFRGLLFLLLRISRSFLALSTVLGKIHVISGPSYLFCKRYPSKRVMITSFSLWIYIFPEYPSEGSRCHFLPASPLLLRKYQPFSRVGFCLE